MSDLLVNFAYAQLAANVAAGDTTITVDDVSTFPSNAALAAADFWLTFDSLLTHPGSWEIVKLTAVDTGTKTLTVTRAQEGTSAVAHSAGSYIKGSITAGILSRLAPVRTTAAAVSASLAPGGTDSAVTVTLARGYRLYSIATSRPARVRLYETTAARTADAGRPSGADPTAGGVVLDYVTAAANTTYPLSPLVDGVSLESVPTSSIPMAVTNLDTTTGTVTVTLAWIRTE